MKTMYNENQKKAFIKQLNNSREPQIAENAFIGIEPYERKQNKDICDIAVRQYPQILAKCCKENLNVQRYSYYMDMMKTLLNYREYCLTQGLITPAVYFESANDKIAYQDLLEQFKQYIQSVELTDPETLYSFYGDLLEIHDEVTPEDYYLGLLILYYYGLRNEDIANIARSQVIKTETGAEIAVKSNKVNILGSCGKHIIKIARSTTNATYYGERLKVYHMNTKYIFARENDATEEERVKTVTNYARYTIGKLKQQKNSPTISDVRHQGAIYRMCEDLIRKGTSKDTLFCLTNKEIYSKYYCYLHNNDSKKIGTSQLKAIEVKYDLEREWKYLEQHR